MKTDLIRPAQKSDSAAWERMRQVLSPFVPRFDALSAHLLQKIAVKDITMNGPSYFEIQADDTKRAVHFYEQVFSWKFTRANEIPIEYFRIETDTSRGGLLKRPAPAPQPQSGTNAFVCSMEVKDFDQTAQRISELGGLVALPKFAVPGTCWQGYFVDTEGNTFGIFQVDRNAK